MISGGKGTVPMQITRRRIGLLVAAGAAASVAGLGRLFSAQTLPQTSATVAEAIAFIQQSGDRLVAILNSTAEWPVKRQQVLLLITEGVDVAGVARFALGRFWNAASEQQRAECVRLFPAVLIGGLGRSIGAYQNLRFLVGRGAQADNTVHVETTVLREGDPPRQVMWVIGLVGTQPKIVDIVAERSSLRVTERDDVLSFMVHNNFSIAALIENLRRQSQPTS